MRGDRAEMRSAAHEPRHAGGFRRQRPAFVGEPPGRRHAIPADRRRPHAAEGRPRDERPLEIGRRPAGSPDRSARDRCAWDRRGTTSARVCPTCQYLRARAIRAAAATAAAAQSPTSSASSGRTKVWCIASAPGGDDVASACIASNSADRRTRLASDRPRAPGWRSPRRRSRSRPPPRAPPAPRPASRLAPRGRPPTGTSGSA